MLDRVPTQPGRKGYALEGVESLATLQDVIDFLGTKFYGVESWEDEPTEEGTAINKTFGDASWLVTYTHTRSGTNNALVFEDGGNIGYFIATADFVEGDTFTVNGTTYAAQAEDGSELPGGFFVADAIVQFFLDIANEVIVFKGGIPRSGGTFTGDVVAINTNRSNASLRNVEVRAKSDTGTLQSTNKIIMVRQ